MPQYGADPAGGGRRGDTRESERRADSRGGVGLESEEQVGVAGPALYSKYPL